MQLTATGRRGIQTNRSNSISAMHMLNVRTFGSLTDVGIPVARNFAIEKLQDRYGARVYQHIHKITKALSRIELKAGA